MPRSIAALSNKGEVFRHDYHRAMVGDVKPDVKADPAQAPSNTTPTAPMKIKSEAE